MHGICIPALTDRLDLAGIESMQIFADTPIANFLTGRCSVDGAGWGDMMRVLIGAWCWHAREARTRQGGFKGER